MRISLHFADQEMPNSKILVLLGLVSMNYPILGLGISDPINY